MIFLASLMSDVLLVLSNSRTTYRSSKVMQESDGMLPGTMHSSNASVTSGKVLHVSQAVFFPLPANVKAVSQPVKA
jgi:hypothetical protein